MSENISNHHISYQDLFKTMTQGVVYQNAEGKIIAVNASAEKILGLNLNQMNGRTSLDPRWQAIHEDGSNFPGDTHPSMVALKTGKEVRDEIMGVFHPNSKTYRWIKINAIPEFRGGEKKPYQVYTTFEDITDQKNIEGALRVSEEKFRNLFRYSNDAIFIHDLDGKIIEANKKALDLFGFTKTEILSIEIFKLHPAEAEEKSNWAFSEILQTGYIKFEIEFKNKMNKIFPAEVSSSLFEIGEKKVVQGIVRDISDRKRAEIKKEQLIGELKEALSKVKVLSGLLPICATCKKIRDDKGRWNQMELYIRERSEAEFSHGICPECAKQMYSDIDSLSD